MTRFGSRWFCWGLFLGVLGMISGCATALAPPSDLEGVGITGNQEEEGADERSPAGNTESPGGDNGSPDESDAGPASADETATWDDDGFSDCGDRTVSSLPGPGFVEMESSFQLDATPADSPLAKVILGGIGCQQPSNTGDVRLLYEIGRQGEVLSLISLSEFDGQKRYIRLSAFDARFVIQDGCLTFESDMPDQDELPDFDPMEIPMGPCGMGQLAIGHEGQVIGGPEGAYICVQAGSANSACQDCWFEDGAWHTEVVASGSYVALGSIDNVSVQGWAAACGQPDQPVSIRGGDRVDFTWTGRIAYRTSPSPEELGYQAYDLPAGP